MTYTPEELTKGFVAELEAFERLVRSLSAEEIAVASRCDGWTVGDVAAHVAGTITDITEGRMEGQGSPEVTDRQVRERRGRSVGELADELQEGAEGASALLAAFDADSWDAPAPGGYDFTLAQGIEALWYDAYVHADDIRAATGRRSEREDGLHASAVHVAALLSARGWGPAVLALDGLEEITIGDLSPGEGPRVEGDPLAFVLAATGRADPATVGLDSSVNVYS